MAHVPLTSIGKDVAFEVDTATSAKRRAVLDERESVLRERRAIVEAGWGQKYVDRVHQKGKLTTRERLDLLVDEAELSRRRDGWTPNPARYTSGMLGKYAKLVQGAETGAITNVL